MGNHFETDNPIHWATFLRGLTFDGETGDTVVSVDEEAASTVTAEGVMTFTARAGEEDVTAAFGAAWKAFLTGNGGTRPDAVVIRGVGGFLIGPDRTAATDLAEGKNPDRRGRPTGRDAVVRDKVVLVTGAAQGFGEGMARELAASGAQVIIADMNRAGAEALAADLNTGPARGTALALEVNVTDEGSVAEMIDAAVAAYGGLDLVVSNAGVLRAGSVKEMDAGEFRFVTEVDYVGFFIVAKHAARAMARQNAGALAKGGNPWWTDIVVISSKSGLEGSNKNGAYAGAKFGVIGLAQSFALELVDDGIKVNALCPGNFLDGPLWSDPKRGLFVQYLETGKVPGAKTIADVRRAYEAKVPMDRGCETADVARALYYVVEQKYETGQAVPITGGQVMLN